MAKIIIILNVKYVILVSTLVNQLEYVVNAHRKNCRPLPTFTRCFDSFRNSTCFRNHLETVYVTIQSRVTHVASGFNGPVLEHACNLSYCSYCSKSVKPDHQCFIEVKKRSNVKSWKYVSTTYNNNNNVYLKSNIQTRSMDCTYKPIKYKSI